MLFLSTFILLSYLAHLQKDFPIGSKGATVYRMEKNLEAMFLLWVSTSYRLCL